MSCNCYYCQTQIEKRHLCDSSYQLSLCGKTCPRCRSRLLTPSVIEEVVKLLKALKGGAQHLIRAFLCPPR